MPRVLGIDPGERRVGLAISDETGVLARPLTVLPRDARAATMAALLDIIRREEVTEIVVGLPISLDGRLGPQARRSMRLAAELRRNTAVPVHLWNEQYTTAEAQRRLGEAGRRPRDRRRLIDAVAAAVILQDFLDSRS